ncbi:hypothetical protein J538_2191 [Acinetobacter sp. 272263]|nr:hypothetical protein J538_2191 [Acinetobacter sp. 272263]
MFYPDKVSFHLKKIKSGKQCHVQPFTLIISAIYHVKMVVYLL